MPELTIDLPDEPAEDYMEWRLVGQPNGGFPAYDVTARTEENILAVQRIWRQIQAGKYPWTDADLQCRRVRIYRSEWQEADR